MVIVRAPVRISFGGGGTDIAAYYTQHGGFVVSSAIARYATVMAYERDDGQIRITSADYGQRESFRHGTVPPVGEPLSLPKAAIARFVRHGLAVRGVDLFLASEVPPGTGLGSSSAMAVALVRALGEYAGIALEIRDIAEIACSLEIDYLGMPIGKQDQYASAFGGLNTIEFSNSGVHVSPLPVRDATLRALDAQMMLFSTGIRRSSGAVLSQQHASMRVNPEAVGSLHRIKGFAYEMCERLCADDLDGFGALLDACWREKKRLSSGVSSSTIDACYEAARTAGALGGKITGAGGGGYLLIQCPLRHQTAVRVSLQARGLEELPFEFDRSGVQTMKSHKESASEPRYAYAGMATDTYAEEDRSYARSH